MEGLYVFWILVPLQLMGFKKLAESACRCLQTCDYVCAVLGNSCALVVELIQNELRGQMILIDQEIIRRLTKHAKLFKARFREMLRVLCDYRVGMSNNRSGEYVAVILIGNAFDCPHKVRRNIDHRFWECLVHLLLSPSYLRSRSLKFRPHSFSHFRQNLFTPQGAIRRGFLSQSQQKITEGHRHQNACVQHR